MQIILPYGKPLAILALMVVALHNLCMSPPPSSFGGLNPNLEFGFFLVFWVFSRAARHAGDARHAGLHASWRGFFDGPGKIPI